MKKLYPGKEYRRADLYPAIFLALLFIVFFSSCTHLPNPVERIGKSSNYLDAGKTGPPAQERARHALAGEGAFEWWYFDGHLDTGETFVGVFYATSPADEKSTVTFALYSPDQKKSFFMKSYQNKEMKFSKNDVDVSGPAGFIRRLDDRTYHVRWNMDGIEADFRLTMTAPGWMPAGQGGINNNSPDFFWNIHQARNRFEGTITQNGRSRSVKGVGYADHNWGTKPLNEVTRHWVWGRIFADDYTIVYADVDYRDPAVNSRPLYIARQDKIIVGTGSPIIRQWDFVMHPELMRYYPRQISVDFNQGGVQASIKIRYKALVEDNDLLMAFKMNSFSRWFARTFIARPSYFRIIADYKGDITEQGRTTHLEGECLYEIVEFE
jgi:hypothetical protein